MGDVSGETKHRYKINITIDDGPASHWELEAKDFVTVLQLLRDFHEGTGYPENLGGATEVVGRVVKRMTKFSDGSTG